jgi:hypothetical protein
MFDTPAGGKVELLRESENSFFSNGLPVTISFVKDETGKVTHLILLNNGRGRAGHGRSTERTARPRVDSASRGGP